MPFFCFLGFLWELQSGKTPIHAVRSREKQPLEYLVDRLLTLFVFLGLLLHLLSLLYLIDELEQVPQVQNHRLSLEHNSPIQPFSGVHPKKKAGRVNVSLTWEDQSAAPAQHLSHVWPIILPRIIALIYRSAILMDRLIHIPSLPTISFFTFE